ncbi:hypothetical protein Tsubulata_034630 [Turnera subulata]|uniref:Uncharacterized protein n=1 Tax=Turnera subulata TaxID=218843 RepID=A0A9Q0J0N3_9ROSI|nr:hypothetical protein Tsubulata_034630 [Turnera subulata]
MRIYLFNKNLDSHMALIINFLRANGLSESNIADVSTSMASLDKLEKNVEELKKTGFSPLNVKFVVGLKALDALSKSCWKKKFDAYKRCGWTEEECEGITDSAIENPFAVSYLTNTFGFTREYALGASKYLWFKSREQPESVINLLKRYGFSQADISKLVKRHPKVLGYSVEIISSKIEFLTSSGASPRDVVAILINNPQVLGRSLENHIIPVYNFIKDVVDSDEKVIAVLRRGRRDLFNHSADSDMRVGMNLLRDNGVPGSNIAFVLLWCPDVLRNPSSRLEQAVEELKEMGFNPSKKTFVTAMVVKIGQSESKWKKKIDVLKSWGWTEEEIFVMFKKCPSCMGYSEKKISAAMDNVVNKLGWGLSVIAKYPALIGLSLEKRIIPRDSVIQSLLSRGLIEKKSYLPKVFMLTDDIFLDKYVNCYECAGELLKLYWKERDESQSEGGNSAIENPFAVSYLTNTFGFTSEDALGASKYLRFKSREQPESVINLLKTYGFSQADISKLVKRYPKVLGFSVRMISSKIEFFTSRAASSRDVVAVLIKNPQVMGRSLENHIIPFYNFIKDMVDSDEKVIAVLKKFRRDLFNHSADSDMRVSMNLLRDSGVPESNIVFVLKQAVEELKEMGFNPSTRNFVEALRQSKWKKKIDVYKSWGWTEEEIFVMFKKYPRCMACSEKKISAAMDFVVNNLGWGLSVIAKYPVLFGLNLEKRIIPRDSVIQSLLSRGLIEKKSYTPRVFKLTDETFLDKYVNCFECADDLLKLYWKER